MASSLPPPGASRPRPPLAPPRPDDPRLDEPPLEALPLEPTPDESAPDESSPASAPDEAGAAQAWEPPPAAARSQPTTRAAGASSPSQPSDEVPEWLRPARVATSPRARPDTPRRDAPAAKAAPTSEAAEWNEADELAPRRWTPERWILLVGFTLVAVALGVVANQAWLMGLPTSWIWWSSIAVVPPGLTGLAALFGWGHARHLAMAATATTAVMALFALVEQPPVGLPQLICAVAAAGLTVAATAASRADARPVGPAPAEI